MQSLVTDLILQGARGQLGKRRRTNQPALRAWLPRDVEVDRQVDELGSTIEHLRHRRPYGLQRFLRRGSFSRARAFSSLSKTTNV